MKIIFSIIVSQLFAATVSATGTHGRRTEEGTKEMRREGTFTSVLNAAQNPTPCDSTALGNGLFTYKDGELCVALSYQGLHDDGVENRSQIHGPAAIGENYRNIIVTFYNSKTPTEEGEQPGTNKNACYNLDEINEAEGYPTGTIENYLFDGLLLVNIHSDYCDKGEIRGQIIASASEEMTADSGTVVPQTNSMLVLLLGLISLAFNL